MVAMDEVVTRNAVAVVLSDDSGRILLAQRGPAARSEAGRWENVGGAVDSGESPELAAKRELLEELDVTVELLGELLRYAPPTDENGIRWETIVYQGRIQQGEPRIVEPHKCSALQWYERDALSAIPLTTYTSEDFQRLGWI